jgi:hypothetical protein
MVHPKLQLSRLLDWLTFRIECDDASPTDEQIVAFLGLDSERTAMSMLADLADRGDITIRGSGAARQIALGRQHRAIETPRPTRSITKPLRQMLSETDGVDRIKAILARKPDVQPDSPAAELEAPASGEGERLEVSDLRAPAPSVPIAAPPSFESQRLPTAPGRRVAAPDLSQYQVNIKVSAERYAELRRRANGGRVGPIARDIFEAAMACEPQAVTAPTPLFRIPAEVTRAAIRDGIPVLDLAATLMMRGLGSFEQDAARERAA